MREIVVLCPNVPGKVAEISAALAEREINIESLDAEGAVSNGVVILCVDQYDAALQALTEAGFSAFSEEAAVIKIEDRPGALAAIAARLKDAQVNIRSLRIVRREEDYALAAIVADDQKAMKAALADELLTISE